MICPVCGFDTPPPAERCSRCTTHLSVMPPASSASQFATVLPSTAQMATAVPASASQFPTGGVQHSQTGVGQGTLPTGASFGRYHIIRLLGSGGMGHVYHAWDGELGEAVALKVIRGEYLSSQEAEARFKRELSVARQVTHKNVIRIFDLGTFEGTKYISMAFVDGGDLGALIKEGKIELERGIEIAKQLCAGLSAAHQAGVVHRDLKPANVMVD